MARPADLFYIMQDNKIHSMIVLAESRPVEAEKISTAQTCFIIFDLNDHFSEFNEVTFINHCESTRLEIVEALKDLQTSPPSHFRYLDFKEYYSIVTGREVTDVDGTVIPMRLLTNYQHFILDKGNPYLDLHEPPIPIKTTQDLTDFLARLHDTNLSPADIEKIRALSVLLPTTFRSVSPPSLSL